MVVSQNTTGVTTNPYRMIQATEKMGSGADVVNNNNATFGLVASVNGPGQIIMDTGYFPFNEFIGAHHLDIRWFSNLASGNGLTVQYWKKDINGIETMCQSVDVPWYGNISPTFGNSASGGWFNQNYQYRFLILSHSSVSATSYVAIDFLKITVLDPWRTGINGLYGGNAPSQAIFLQDTISTGALSGNYTYTFVTTCSFNPSIASIIGISPQQDLILAVIASDSSTFTWTLTHRAGTTWSTSNMNVQFQILMMDPFLSL
jgi:hypothetical protein